MFRALIGHYYRVRDALGFKTKLYNYESYEAYRAAQIAGNKRKIENVFVKEPNIARIAAFAEGRLGTVGSVLCHGTRNGAEQSFFRKHLKGAPRILGTEISDTAAQFPDTVQWDFHEMNPEWVGQWDLVYSNSWDHAYDPEKAFGNWLKFLSPRGLLMLEHTKTHEPKKVCELDPFGASVDGLVAMLNRLGAPERKVIAVIDDLPDQRKKQKVVVVGPVSA